MSEKNLSQANLGAQHELCQEQGSKILKPKDAGRVSAQSKHADSFSSAI